ncbi:MAG: hypothetical protein ABIR18_00895 [Chitinophagaceae bacterium]
MSVSIVPNPSDLSPAQLPGYIISVHHQYVRASLKEIMGYIKDAVREQSKYLPELREIKKAFISIKKELTHHIHAEEPVPFSSLKSWKWQVAQTLINPRLHRRKQLFFF